MTREEVIQTLTSVATLIGEEAFSEAWTSFIDELIEDEHKFPIPVVPIDKNYSEDDEE